MSLKGTLRKTSAEINGIQKPRKRKFPMTIFDVDRSGMIKLSTLEYLAFQPASAKELYNSFFESGEYSSIGVVIRLDF